MTPAELPVALFAYNRPDVLERTLGCLRAAGFRRLVVFSDGPRGPGDVSFVERVRDTVRAVAWADVELVERSRNLGLSGSVVAGMAELFDRFDRAAVIEDDVLVAPEFGAFAAAAIERYAGEPRVAGVTALRLPFPAAPLDASGYDACFLPRFFSWGWATWRDAWAAFDLDADSLLTRLRSSPVRLERAGADLPYMVRRSLVKRELGGAWDVRAATSMVLDDRLFLVPAWNMSENAGFEQGTHPQSPRWPLRWERGREPSGPLRLPPVGVDEEVLQSFLRWREDPQGWTARRLVPRPVRRLARRVRRTYDPFR